MGGRQQIADFEVPNGCSGGAKKTVNCSKNCFLGRITRSQVAAKSVFYLHESQILVVFVVSREADLKRAMCKKHCKYREKTGL